MFEEGRCLRCGAPLERSLPSPLGEAFSTDELLAIYATSLRQRPEQAWLKTVQLLGEYARLAHHLASLARRSGDMLVFEDLTRRAREAETRARRLRRDAHGLEC
jgi:hypothetical protein